VRGGGAGGPADRHRRRGRDWRAVTSADDALGGLEAGEGHHLLDVRGAIEPHDRRLAEHGLDPAQRADRVIPNRSARARPDVGGESHPLADRERGWGLLFGARWTSRLRPWGRPGDDHRCDDGHLLLLVLVLVVLVLIVDDLDVLDSIHLDHVINHLGVDDLLDGRRLLGLVLGGGGGWRAVVGGASGHM
jgi:hypothetical protein